MDPLWIVAAFIFNAQISKQGYRPWWAIYWPGSWPAAATAKEFRGQYIYFFLITLHDRNRYNVPEFPKR